jgi:hypothetical protein
VRLSSAIPKRRLAAAGPPGSTPRFHVADSRPRELRMAEATDTLPRCFAYGTTEPLVIDNLINARTIKLLLPSYQTPAIS